MRKFISAFLSLLIFVGLIADSAVSFALDSVDKTKLESLLTLLNEYTAEQDYSDVMSNARVLLTDESATAIQVNECTNELMMIYYNYANPKVEFDSSNIVLSFGAVSDVHLDPNDAFSVTKYENALNILMDRTKGELDVMTIAGDMSQNSYRPAIPRKIIELNKKCLSDDTEFFFVTGNHDASSTDGYSADLTSMFEEMAEYLDCDLPSSQHERGNRHAIINGYHFIGVNMLDYWNSQDAMFMDEDLEWLDRELAAARSDAPGKPIFLYTHAAVYGTTYGSTEYTGSYWGSKKIYDHLKDYPEVVNFSGHVHWPVHDNRSIYQKDFTSLNCGEIYYMAIDGAQTGLTSEQTKQLANGYLVQVDINNNIKLTRLDFMTNKVIKDPFYISAPDMKNKTHLLRYNPEYLKLFNKAPEFAKGSKITTSLSDSKMNVTFPAADDDDMVNNYLIEVKSIPSGHFTFERWFSDFYLYSKPSEYPDSYTRTVSVNMGTDIDYEVKVYAEDSLECLSEPIVYNTLTTPDEIINSVGGDLINIDFIKGETRNAVSNNTQTIRVTNGEIVKVNGKYAYHSGDGSHINISATTSINTLTSRKFTAEVTFVPNDFDSSQYIFSCIKDTKGYAFILNEDGTLTFTINNVSSGSKTVTSSLKLEPGKVYSAVAVFSTGLVELYINGAKEGSASVKGNASFNNSTPYVVGAKIGNGSTYTDYFDGYVYQVCLYNSSFTNQQVIDRYADVNNSFKYKIMKPLYDELGYISSVKDLNANNSNATLVCDNYINDLNAALNSASINDNYINEVMRREKYIRNLKVLNAYTQIKDYSIPNISGVEDGGVYDISSNNLVISFSDYSDALINHNYINNNYVVNEVGDYQMIVINHDKSVVVEFKVEKRKPEIKKGDFDNDGDITVADALAALRIAAKLVIEDDASIAIGDVDNDKHVTVADALAILRVAAKLADNL